MAAPPLPPGPREPATAQTLEWVLRPTALLRRCAARHGDAFTLRLTFDDAPTVLVSSPAAVRDVWAASPEVLRRGQSPGPLRRVAGPRSILLADGAEHLRIRRLMLPPLHGERIADLAGEVGRLSREAVARWPRGRPVALLGELRRLTLDVMLQATFGVRDDRLAALVDDALAVARSAPRMASMALGPIGWRGFERRIAAVDVALRAAIARRRAAPEPGDDLLGVLLEAHDTTGAPLSDDEVRDHLVTLLAAGHDTTAAAAAWAIERLARRPDWTAALRDGGEAELDAVARETLRVRPVLTVAPRKLAAPLAVGGRELPAGVHVAPCIYLLHRRADLYRDPTAWRPERWLGGLGPMPDTAAWIPFGGGVRRCVGAAFALVELRELLRAVTAAVDLEPAGVHGERMRRRGVTLHPGAGARVVLRDAV
jgi:cytochrome P450 family 135